MGLRKLQSGSLNGSISSKGTLSGTISKPEFLGGEEYTGAYEIAPTFNEQTMPTKHKVLSEDITVKPIAVIVVSNPSGGNTVYIGDEV